MKASLFDSCSVFVQEWYWCAQVGVLLCSEDDEQGENAVKEEDRVCYKISLVSHL